MLDHALVRRVLSLVLSLSIIFSLVPISIKAATPAVTTAPRLIAPATAAQPSALAQSLSIARVQSQYTAGTLDVIFTLSNNLPVTRVPAAPPGATDEQLADAFANFDPLQDANTLRSIIVTDTLAAGVTLIATSGNVTQTGSALTWQLPDLPPQSSAQITLTIQTPSAGSDFINLDTGAQASALRWGTVINAHARSASIIPTGLDAAFVANTSAADPDDPELIWYTAGFEQDPLAAFTAVQSFRTDLYQGALRGTRGTLWGEAGNSLDKSSALIAMLRAVGIPARYRHGTLNTTQAKALIASLFPTANGVAGYLPIGTTLADPVNDAALIALASDHWWVEAYLPGSGWTNLDPTYPQAAAGQAFASPSNDGTDRAADVPSSVHHTLRVRLKKEQYNTFPVGGVTLATSYPLDEVFNVSQLAGKRLTLGHLVHEVIQGGVFSSITRDYTPYVMIEDNGVAYEGTTFQEILTNFPLATTFTTAEWLEYEIHSPDGYTATFAREVKDLIGAATRRLGGSPQLAVGTSSGPFFGAEDLYVNWVLPNAVSEWAAQRQSVGVLARLKEAGTLSQAMLEIASRYTPGTFLSEADEAAYRAARVDRVFVSEFALSSIGLNFARQADAALSEIEHGLRTRLYYATPRVFTVSSIGTPAAGITSTVDLRHTAVKAVVYPGQAAAAEQTAQWIKGLNESILEGEALTQGQATAPLTTMRVFDEMTAQGIDAVLLLPNEYGLLDAYPFSDDALAHVIEALLAGKQVLIPARAVTIDGEPTFAWWEIDPVTGETISVGENGLHVAAIELFVMILEEFIDELMGGLSPVEQADPVELAEAALSIGMTLRGWFFAAAAGISGGNRPDQPARVEASTSWRSLPAYLCPVATCGVEQFFMDTAADQLPLPEVAFTYGADAVSDVAIATMTASATGSGTPAFTLAANPSASSIAPGTTSIFQAQITSNFADDFTVAVYAPIGWAATITTTGQISIRPAEGVAPGNYVIQLVAQSKSHPELIQTATHTITIQNSTSAQLSIAPELKITVAMGLAALNADPNETNDGEVEVPGAAYTIVLTNTSAAARTFDVNVSGPPADWLILSAARSTTATVTLAAGEVTKLGLYVSPSNGTLPAVNTNYPIDVTATSTPINVQASSVFVMPPQPFNRMTLDPANLYLPPNSSTPVVLNITNIGNAAGNFDLSVHALPISGTINGLPASHALAQSASASLPLTLTLGAATPGATFPLVIAGKAISSTSQYATANVRVAGPYSGGVFQAADQLKFCPLSEPRLSATLTTLAVAMANLEASCDAGACDVGQRDQAVLAAQDAANYAGSFSPLVTADDALLQAANSLATHITPLDVETDLAAMRDAIASRMADQMCALSEHMPSVRWSTGYSAALIDQSRDTVLEVKNLGTLTTTYAVTVSLPSGSQSFNVLVNPGATVTTTYALSNNVTGLINVNAQATAIGPEVELSGLTASATTRLNVLDRFVQLTAVNPNPAFVETGLSSSTVAIEVNNLANVPIDTTALITITSPDNTVAYSSTQPLRVMGAVQTYNLNAINTSGWTIGVYTVTVNLRCTGDLCDAPNAVPNGQGYGFLTVGQGLQIEHAVSPEEVTAGTFTVTTFITSEITTPAIQPPAAQPPSPLAPLPQARGNAPLTTWAITRTENSSPAIVVSGTWTVVSNVLALRASNGDYSWADAVNETAVFTFTGTWINLGFVSAWNTGQADILIDGVNVGLVDTYTRHTDVREFIFDNLSAGTHTVTIRVRGTRHPNSTGIAVMLDYIDVWDGTDMPLGRVEQDSPRVWRSASWGTITDTVASGGTYMSNGNLDTSAWFPFTGDSISFIGHANFRQHRLIIAIDGEERGRFNMYSATSEQRVISFNNLGPGPHILRVQQYSGEFHVDAFETPGFGPFYEPPTPIGFTRYEEYHPAFTYNGYPYHLRPQTWNEDLNVPIVSDGGLVEASAVSTITLNFYGVWANIGFRTRSDGGRAEIRVDGASVGTIGLYSTTSELKSFVIDNLITGTHTLEIIVLNQPDPPGTGRFVYFDYVEVWDGTPVADGFVNAQRHDADGRLRFNDSGEDALAGGAIDGDFFTSGLPNSYASVWYPFVGDAFTLYGFSRANTSIARVYVDDVLIDTPNFNHPFSEQPIAKHYNGFGDGPHIVRVINQATMRIDGFASNPDYLGEYQPFPEWYESDQLAGASWWGGVHVPPSIGDLEGDGTVEIVVPASVLGPNGQLSVLRGDGGDTGDGDPIKWTHVYSIFNGFEHVSAAAIAELDGLPGAEIVHPSEAGVYAFHADGSIYWYTDTLRSQRFFAGPAIGNLDADPEPEIVINLNDDLVVFEHDGTVAWRKTDAAGIALPVLADLTGDGQLDILYHTGQWGGSNQYRMDLYDYNLGSPTLVWTQTLTSTVEGYGSPAVADIDGNLPGGDPGPEIAIATSGALRVFNGEDGSPVWSTPIGYGRPGNVSIADLDGDGEIEIVAGMVFTTTTTDGRLYAFNADGSILWSVTALDNSPINASVFDLNGDGAYEVAYNGAGQGLTIYDGHNGDVLFNEPNVNVISQTGTDYPVFADVDNDGFGELVVASWYGLRVFGYDEFWTEARPVWNQLNYHINNINDNLSVPFSEWNSWDTHNTYRTQSPLRYPMPNYAVDLTHTVGLNNVSVLTNTFSITPDRSSQPDYGWAFLQDNGSPIVTRTFQSLLTNLQPGESRMVAQGTQVSYTLSSGSNMIVLPPLYVNVAPLITLSPSAQSAPSGVSAIYTVTVRNAQANEAIFSLDLAGLPATWYTLPPTITIPANSTLDQALIVTIPIGSGSGPWTFSVAATSGLISGQAGGEISVGAPTFTTAITPTEQTAPVGAWATYTLTLNNSTAAQHTYLLNGAGLAEVNVSSPITVAANSTHAITFTARVSSEGPHPFAIEAERSDTGERAEANAILIGSDQPFIVLTLDPAARSIGPGNAAVFNVTLHNLGDQPATLDLNVDAPANWGEALTLYGQNVNQVTVAPAGFNTLNLQLALTPPDTAAAGTYTFTVHADQFSVVGTVQVVNRGVQVDIVSGPTSILPGVNGTWQVSVKNAGTQSDTFDLSAFGALSLGATFTPNSVTLAPGASQTVQLQATPGIKVQTGTLWLGALAQAHTDSSVRDEDALAVQISSVKAAAVAWQPAALEILTSTVGVANLTIENTGNTATTFTVALNSIAHVTSTLPYTQVALPPSGQVALPVNFTGDLTGTYQITATVTGGASPVQAQLALNVNLTPRFMYLPIVVR